MAPRSESKPERIDKIAGSPLQSGLFAGRAASSSGDSPLSTGPAGVGSPAGAFFSFRTTIPYPILLETLAKEYLGPRHFEQVLAVLVVKQFFALSHVVARGPEFTRSPLSRWPPIFEPGKKRIRVCGVKKGDEALVLPAEVGGSRITDLWVLLFDLQKQSGDLYTAPASVLGEAFIRKGDNLTIALDAFTPGDDDGS